MKHPVGTTVILILLFVAAQVIGLALLSRNIQEVKVEDGKRIVQHATTALGDRPQTHGLDSLLFIIIGVAIGTGLVLLLIRLKIFGIWKIWFLIAVWFATTIAVGVLIPSLVALVICFILALWKVYWPNPIVHNLTEVFMYAGIAILLVPLFSLVWVALLLVIISIYDVYAVWHSKHMVVIAEAQTKSKVFAGLLVPKYEATHTNENYTEPPRPPLLPKELHGAQHGAPAHSTSTAHAAHAAKQVALPEAEHTGGGSAILGGGDIAFPLIFSGVVMDWLVEQGATKVDALYMTLIVTISATLALSLLFLYAKKDKFYPAMPFLTLGCFAGLGVLLLLRLLV